MSVPGSKPILLVAEDNEADRYLMQRVFDAARLNVSVRFFEDGADLLDYLYRRGRYTGAGDEGRPDLLLLDVAMPKVDGRAALKVIRQDCDLADIPVVFLTAHTNASVVADLFTLGASGVMSKTADLYESTTSMECLVAYYLQSRALVNSVH